MCFYILTTNYPKGNQGNLLFTIASKGIKYLGIKYLGIIFTKELKDLNAKIENIDKEIKAHTNKWKGIFMDWKKCPYYTK